MVTVGSARAAGSVGPHTPECDAEPKTVHVEALYTYMYLVSYFSMHTGQVSSFGGCMAQVSYLDTARRPVSLLAKKPRFVTT